jgi:hypothetical protein
MKMKATVFSAVTLAVCFLAGAANAAPTFSGKFTFPYEVHWGRAVLPAGNYSITIDRFEPAAIVRSTNGKTHFVVMHPPTSDSFNGGTFLFITVNGGQRRVRYLNIPRIGKSLIYEPLTKPEQEAIARGGQLQAMPVAVAEK